MFGSQKFFSIYYRNVSHKKTFYRNENGHYNMDIKCFKNGFSYLYSFYGINILSAIFSACSLMLFCWILFFSGISCLITYYFNLTSFSSFLVYILNAIYIGYIANSILERSYIAKGYQLGGVYLAADKKVAIEKFFKSALIKEYNLQANGNS